MLQITRRAGERILIGDDVTIEVIEVSGSTVRVGISAPRSLPVYREELWTTVKRENEAAAGVKPDDVAGIVTAGGAQPERRSGEHRTDQIEEEATPCP